MSSSVYKPPKYYEVLLYTVNQMLDEHRSEIAVVTAQMACEIFAEITLSEIFRVKSLSYLEDPIDELLPTYNFANEKVRKLYVALTGDNIHHAFFWADYKQMVALRNKAVHAGGRVPKGQAEVGVRTAEHFITHLSHVLVAMSTPTALKQRA